MTPRLLRLAAKAQHSRSFHAVLVKRGGAVLAAGYNHGHIHAEVMALNQLWPSKRAGTVVWSVRVTRGGRLAMAKPCPRCETYLRANGVKKVVYSSSEGVLETMRL